MKKILISLLTLVFLSGCVNINKLDLDKVIDVSLDNKHKLVNQNNRGFKYYLPQEVSIEKYDSYNVVLKNKNYNYYLFVDLTSYYYKKAKDIKVDENLYLSKEFNVADNKGIVNIYKSTKKEDVYLIKAYYNYSEISAFIKGNNLNDSLNNMLTILSSVKYNDKVIKNIVEESTIDSKEEPVNVFKVEGNENDILDIDEEYIDDEDNVDRDVIN